MATEVIGPDDMREPIIRGKKLSVSNDGSMMAIHDYGEFGTTVTDEPLAHGGTSEGPSPASARTCAVYAEVETALLSRRGATPTAAACDLHPDYASTRRAEASGLPLVRVQHHEAHALAVLAEHDLAPPALGISWDGTGLGTDGTIYSYDGLDRLLLAQEGSSSPIPARTWSSLSDPEMDLNNTGDFVVVDQRALRSPPGRDESKRNVRLVHRSDGCGQGNIGNGILARPPAERIEERLFEKPSGWMLHPDVDNLRQLETPCLTLPNRPGSATPQSADRQRWDSGARRQNNNTDCVEFAVWCQLQRVFRSRAGPKQQNGQP